MLPVRKAIADGCVSLQKSASPGQVQGQKFFRLLACLVLAAGFVPHVAAAIPAYIDINPWSTENVIDPASSGNVVVVLFGASTVAGDPEDIDVSLVEPTSVFFGSGNAQNVLSAFMSDFNGDGVVDRAFVFSIIASGIACGDTDVILRGMLQGGVEFSGSDSISTVGCIPPVLAAQIDIDPWSTANTVSPNAGGNIIVAVLGAATLAGDPEDFDVTQIEPSSVLFGPGDAHPVLTSPIADFNDDTTPDRAFVFDTADVGLSCDDDEATLGGVMQGGTQFSGVDALEITDCDASCHPTPPGQVAVVANAGGGGRVDPTVSMVNQGAVTEFVITPESGFIVDTVSGCDGSLNGSNYVTGSVNNACEISATFWQGFHTVTASAGTGGIISPALVEVGTNETPIFTVTAESGFAIGAVSGCNGLLVGDQYTTGPVIASCAVNANFVSTGLPIHTVSTSASSGGSIYPASALVNTASTASFALAPDPGFRVHAVNGCDGTLAGNTYLTGAISLDCQVSAVFVPSNTPTYAVDTQVGAGGAVSPASTVLIPGETVSLAVTPNGGNRLQTISGCNGILEGGSYNIGPIAAGCTVRATFQLIPPLEIYLSDFSVPQAGTIDVHVSTTLPNYDVVVSRIAPLTELARFTDIPGTLQPVGANAYQAGVNWTSALQIPVAASWPSGIYEIRVEGQNTAQQLEQNRAYFVVREVVAGQVSKVLVLDNATTVSAYSNWGGKSMYDFNSQNGTATSVWIRRPDNFRIDEEIMEFANWAAALGYELEWASLYDLHYEPALLDPYETVIILGHNEYWSASMRNAFDAHTAGGGNALVLSGNTMWFQVRFEGDQMVCYKNYLDDPLLNVDNALVTTNFFDEPVYDPENRSIGVSWRHGGYVNHAGHYLAADGWGGYIVADPDHELLAATGLAAGEMFGQSTTIVGYEADGAMYEWVDGRAVATGVDGTPTNFEIVGYAPAHSRYTSFPWFLNPAEFGWDGAATFGSMLLPSGGRVTNMATVDWADGLFKGKLAPSDRDGIADEQVSRITFNALRQFGHLPTRPGIKGAPDFAAGQDLGVFVWKEYFDGPYHITTSGKGASERFTVTVISSGEITDVSGWSLAGSDTLITGGNWLEFDSYVSTAAEGIEFSIAPSGTQNDLLVLGVRRQGGTGPFDVKLGRGRKPQYPDGWMLQPADVPALPSYTAGADLGMFAGSEAPELPLQIRWSSNGQFLPGSVQVIATDVGISATPIDMEANDQLYVGDNFIRAYGEVAADADGVDVSFTGSPARIAVLANLDGLFETRLVNGGSLGNPDTILLPLATAHGAPAYEPAQEAALRVWLDASGTWQILGSAGGESRHYSGAIESSQPISDLVSVGLQPADTVVLVNPNRVEFSISMSGSDEAGFTLQAAPGSALSLDLNEGPEALRIGAESWPVVSVPVDISG